MTVHDPDGLGAHALGLLGGATARAVEEHLAGCAGCRTEFASLRATVLALEQVPPEMFLDGPPDSDLVVRRAARAVRAEAGGPRRRRRFAAVAAAVAVGVALLGGGALLGRGTVGSTVVAEGARTVQATSGEVSLTATITPAAGWVRVATSVTGIDAGTRCTIVVIGRDGTENVAGSWLASAPGGAVVDGAAIVDPTEVVGVAIRDAGGTDLVTVPA